MEHRDFGFLDSFEGDGENLPGYSDRDLVAICREGNLDAYRLLISRYEDDLYRFGRILTGNPEDAFDIARKSFVNAFPRVWNFHPHSTFKTTLFREAISQIKQYLGQKAHLERLEQKTVLEETELLDASPYLLRGPIGEKEILQWIRNLSLEEGITLILRDVLGYTLDEISRIIQRSGYKIQIDLSEARLHICSALYPHSELIPEIRRCQKCYDSLSDFIEGKLDTRLYEQMSDHMRTCLECNEDLQLLQKTLAEISRIGSFRIPDNLWKCVENHLVSGKTNKISISEHRENNKWKKWVMILIVTLSLILAGILIWTQNWLQPHVSHLFIRPASYFLRGGLCLTNPQGQDLMTLTPADSKSHHFVYLFEDQIPIF